MAFDFNTISGVAEIAQQAESSFNYVMGAQQLDISNLVDQTINHLTEKIKGLEGLEEDFKDSFECSSLEAFEERVSNYYNNNNLLTFTGVSLSNIVEDFKTQLDAQSAESQRKAMALFQGMLNSYLGGPYQSEVLKIMNNEKVGEEFAEQIMYEFRSLLNQNADLGSLKSHTHHFRREKRGTKEVLTLVASKGTKAFRDYVDAAYEKAMKNGGQLKDKFKFTNQKTNTTFKKNTIITINTTSQVTDTTIKQTFGVNFADMIRSSGTKMLTKTELENRLNNGQITKRDISNKNRDIINLICDELNVTGDYRDFVKRRIGSMLTKDPYLFYVGNSFTGLEGILGEINAVIAITALLGSKYKTKALHWIGSQPGVYSKKQPSIDLVVDNLLQPEKAQFGFQVKNTINEIDTDITHYIGFANKDLNIILENAGIDSDAIEAVYISDIYNVPYKRKGEFYKQVEYNTSFDNDDPSLNSFLSYIEVDKKINEIIDKIDIYLARFASDFIYMQNPDFKSKLATLDNQIINSETTGNFCYIVGSKVFFAKKMLSDLQMDLQALQGLKKDEQLARLQFETYFSKKNEKGGEGYNIVNYMNDDKDTLDNYTIKMRSSWGF